LTWKYQNSLIILQTSIKIAFIYINQNYASNFENIMYLLNHVLCIYIPWIICRGNNLPSMWVINWIKCMGGWITCSHKSFRKGEKEQRQGGEKGRRKRYDLACRQYTNACKLTWPRYLKPWKWIMTIFFIIKISHFFM
jgi:hypothetical protein